MTILAAVDGTPISSRVVAQADDLARAYGEDLHVFHVMEDDEANRRIDERNDYFLDTAEKDARKVADDIVTEAADATNVEVSGHVGDPSTVIEEQVTRREPRYLVIGGRKRSAVGKALLGSVLQKTLQSAQCPVVTVIKQNS